jgi:hypothetical protein
MTYKEFLELESVKKHIGYYCTEYRAWRNTHYVSDKVELSHKNLGGWGENEEVQIHSPQEDDYTELTYILDEVAPNITFSQFYRLTKSLVKHEEEHDSSGYYVHYNYRVWKINFYELYNYLVENNYIQGETVSYMEDATIYKNGCQQFLDEISTDLHYKRYGYGYKI